MEAGIVMIGAGEAGPRAAVSLRECGLAAPITLSGRETHVPYERPCRTCQRPWPPSWVSRGPQINSIDLLPNVHAKEIEQSVTKKGGQTTAFLS